MPIPKWTILIAAGLLFIGAAQKKAPPEKLTGGNGTLYIGVFPDRILIIDEATEKITGEIKTRTGVPRRMSLSEDRKRFYVTNADMEHVEVADIASRRVIDNFNLNEGEKKNRIRSLEADPLNRYMIVLVRSSIKLADRFEIGAPTLLQYDLKEHKVLRTIPWPKGEEREFANMKFSPDGKLLYFFSEDVLIYDTAEFKQIDKWEISRPIEEGFGRINFNSLDDANEEPGFFTGIFTVQDSVQHRRVMGVARVNLFQKIVDFYTLGPATGVSFSLAPGRKRAYGLHQEIGRYEFWTFDLENRKLHGKTEFAGRPRMALKTSSNGKILYIYQAGNTIDLYDAANYSYLRTLTLDGDQTTSLFVMAPEQPGSPASANR
jgi:hypothetical protein